MYLVIFQCIQLSYFYRKNNQGLGEIQSFITYKPYGKSPTFTYCLQQKMIQSKSKISN